MVGLQQELLLGVLWLFMRHTVSTLHYHRREEKQKSVYFYLSLVSSHTLQERIKGREIGITIGQSVQRPCPLFLSCCCINTGNHGNIFAIFYRL